MIASIQHSSRTNRGQISNNQLTDCVTQCIERLDAEQIYNHPSHNFTSSGDKLRGACPFHESKSGTSFVVTKSNKLFYCAGCQFGGSPVDYFYSLKVGSWQKPRGKDFVDVVRELASLAQITFPELKSSPEQIEKARTWERRKSILQEVSQYCQQVLWSDRGTKAREYLLQQRKLPPEGIKNLGLGFFPSVKEVNDFLTSKGYDYAEIKSLKLVVLQGYITYPWQDSNGRPLTIYGRWHSKYSPKGKPKTIALPGKSTKQSPLYFDRALKSHHKEIVLVEGVNDAALAQALGLTDVCAYVAASCSNEQIETIKRKRIEKVILCGDPDHGGDRGTKSNLDRFIQSGISVFIAPKLPNGLDPDEFMIKHGIEAWNEHIRSSEHGFRWRAKRILEQYGTETDAQLEALLRAALTWANTIPVSRKVELETFFWTEICKNLDGINVDKMRQSLASEVAETDVNRSQEKNQGEFNPFTPEALKQEIEKLIIDGVPHIELKSLIPDLAEKWGYYSRDVWEIYNAIEKKLSSEEDLDLFHEEINNLLNIYEYDLELNRYIPNDLANELSKLAIYLGVNCASLLTCLLTVAATLIPINTKLKLIEATGFYAHPILYSGICAESGSCKSPLIKAIIKPLLQLQSEEDKRYQKELAIYQEQYQQWKKAKDTSLEPPEKPKLPREFLVSDATSEAIAGIQNNQPNNGFLGWFDELAALIGQQNAYRGGRGADAEKILSGRDGTGFKINRADGKRINCSRSGYSILGGIQPDILKKYMGDFTDPSGFWARFIWVNLPLISKIFPEDQVSIILDDLLYALYKNLGKVKRTFKLSPDAQKTFKDWFIRSEQLKMAEPKQALRAVYSKSQRLAGELALILHCIKSSFHQEEASQEVGSEIMRAAIQLTKFYIGQVKLIHANSCASKDNLPATYFKIINLSKRKGWLKAKDVQNGIRDFKKEQPNQIRSIFQELKSLGYGVTQYEGNKLIWNVEQVDVVDDK